MRLEGIVKSFPLAGAEEFALRGVSMTVREGEFVCVSGPSGSGKSTLLSIIALLDFPTSGRYEFAGKDMTALDIDAQARIRNANIGLVFQKFNLIGTMTILDNVALPLMYRGTRRTEREWRAREMLKRLGLGARCDVRPGELSGGEQQRVAVARALVGEPRLVLADEPTGNLDQRNGETIMDMLSDLNAAGAAVVLVTHDARFVERAERTVFIADGAIHNSDEDAT